MPDDDLLALLLGCGCRKRCCCGASPDPLPGPPATPLFGQAPRTILPPRLPDETPFIPGYPSYDSPQRPGNWGGTHLPRVDAAGRFIPGGAGWPVENVLTQEGGVARLLDYTEVNHATREVRTYPLQPGNVQGARPNSRQYGVPSTYATGNKRDPRFTLVPDPPIQFQAGSATGDWPVQRLDFAGGGYDLAETITTTGHWRAFRAQLRDAGTGQIISPYLYRVRWLQQDERAPGSPSSMWRQVAQVVYETGPNRITDTVIIETFSQDQFRAVWEDLGETVPLQDTPTDNNGFVQWDYQLTSSQLAWVPSVGPIIARPVPTAPRWRDATGQITVTGPVAQDHAQLETAAESVLTAYGVRFEDGGTWAALSGPDGRAWVLHELEGAVTLVRPDLGAQTLGRAAFEREVLRAPTGSFRRFAQTGLLATSFPAQLAWADCGLSGGLRAVIPHDPWRDSVTGKPPTGSTDPAHWYWPGRPRRRPDLLPPDAPAAPLGLTLADVMTSANDGIGDT